MTPHQREELARKRLLSVLRRHGIATARTLEQKISDAGPSNQRIDPHILTPVRTSLLENGLIAKVTHANAPWYHAADTPQSLIQERLEVQLPLFRRFQHGNLGPRLGQCLEIAVYRALLNQDTLDFFGAFVDLDQHDDSALYRKEEPPQSISGKRVGGNQRLDFLAHHPDAGWAGIEVKNVREWLYPNREEITDLLRKAIALDCVPVLIARRFPFVTFKVLSNCGVILHQTFNQLLPEADREFAEKIKHKNTLGYHDIRTGNQPDNRLIRFIGTNLPSLLPNARERFDVYNDLLTEFAFSDMSYEEFAARVRRRSHGQFEDGDWDPPYDQY